MYLIGGHGYEGKVNSVYRLNVQSCRWLHITEPEPLQNFSPRDKFAAWEYHDTSVAFVYYKFIYNVVYVHVKSFIHISVRYIMFVRVSES